MIVPLFQKAENGCFCDACTLIYKREEFYKQHYDCPIKETLSSDTIAEVIYLTCIRHNCKFSNYC